MKMRRILQAAIALIIPIAGATFVVSEPAGAIGVTTTCASISGAAGGTFVFSHCTGGSTGGSSVPMDTNSFFQFGGLITWSNGNTTNISSQAGGALSRKQLAKCVAKFGATSADAKVTGVVSASNTGETPIPGAFKAKVCDSSGAVHNLGAVTIN
jgi:hypothetical protein